MATYDDTLAETVTVNGAFPAFEWGKSVADTVTATDTMPGYAEWGKTIADSVTGSDTLTGDVAKLAYDYIIMQAALMENWAGGEAAAETLTLVDYATLAQTFMHLLAETPGISDSALVDYGRQISDAVALAESVLGSWTGTGSLTETLTLVDQTAFARAFLDLLAEVLTATEALERPAYGSIARDIISALDTAGSNWSGSRQLCDGVSLLDSLANGYLALLVETLVAADSPLALFALACSAADILTGAEAVDPLRTSLPVSGDSITITSTVTAGAALHNALLDEISFSVTVTINGVTYQCWVFNTDELYPSIYSNFNFNSFAELAGVTYAANDAGIYKLEGASDNGTAINTGVHVNYQTMGTHLKKSLQYAYFGLTGDQPTLKMINEDGEEEYYVFDGKAKLARGHVGREWQLKLTDITGLEWIEITPVVMSR